MMIPNNTLVTSRFAVAQVQKPAQPITRIGKLFATTFTSGLLLFFISPLPSMAENVVVATVQEKTTELTKKCQEKYGLNSEHPDKAALKKCLARVLKACKRHTNGNAELCKQWMKDA
ncbi:hypothetical protein ACQFX9_22935 [Aliinostoc sp. HNIBRCY26]|uniref:hypothetical protein n=1 Tax=Aliinostoc sp. HNIBRCY26 TaxID=3418997 RepID=UPI003D04582F